MMTPRLKKPLKLWSTLLSGERGEVCDWTCIGLKGGKERWIPLPFVRLLGPLPGAGEVVPLERLCGARFASRRRVKVCLESDFCRTLEEERTRCIVCAGMLPGCGNEAAASSASAVRSSLLWTISGWPQSPSSLSLLQLLVVDSVVSRLLDLVGDVSDADLDKGDVSLITKLSSGVFKGGKDPSLRAHACSSISIHNSASAELSDDIRSSKLLSIGFSALTSVAVSPKYMLNI